MDKDTPQKVQPRFSDVCQMHHLDYQAMQAIAEKARVSKHVVDSMSVSVAVRRQDALKILAALGDLTGQSYTLDTVKVALRPTFKDFHSIHQFDLAILSTASSVSFDIISMLLHDEPIPKREARAVLQAASMQTGQSYTLDNVDVKTN